MPASRKYWENRAEKQFAEWDAIEDPYNLPSAKFQKAIAGINEASTICMVMEACDRNKRRAS